MTTYLASFLVFLGAAAALALGRFLGRPAGKRCGDCTARRLGDCTPPAQARREVS